MFHCYASMTLRAKGTLLTDDGSRNAYFRFGMAGHQSRSIMVHRWFVFN